jgi:hypothetical protein
MVIFCYKLLNETEQLTCHSEIHVNVVLPQAGALASLLADNPAG